MKYRAKHIAEYAGLRLIAAMVSILPYRAALAFGWVLAGLAFFIGRRRVAIAEARIREVFGDRFSRREVRRIAWISLRNLFFNAIDSMCVSRLTPESVESVTDRTAAVHLFEHGRSGKGAILVVPHTGNWEFAGVGSHLLGLPLFLIVGKQKNPLTDAWINSKRGATGIELIPRDSGALKKAVRNMREGKILTFMTDLRSKTPGVSVQFLGKTANVVGGMALFARMANVPIFPAVCTRIGWTRHRWNVFDPIYPSPDLEKEADWTRMTQQVMDVFDKAIRAEPEQYFWYNKRWVLDPLEEDQRSTLNTQHPTSNLDVER